jgi:hypothetical protein
MIDTTIYKCYSLSVKIGQKKANPDRGCQEKNGHGILLFYNQDTVTTG